MDPVLKKYATATVPRYTSYPSVPHFDKNFQAATYRSWLSAIDPTEPISLYLHVPFCQKLCWYCGCNMKLAARYDPVSDYVDTLIKEIALVCDNLPGRMKISHLHWGGGTPTVLKPDDLERVMQELSKRFEFTHEAELAIESDPRTLTQEMIERIGLLGFTRASFGVQEFDPKVQEAINRIQPSEMVRSAVEGLRAAGVNKINFDLIYGLPYQTVDSLSRTIDLSLSMQPDRLALFGYAHVPWMAKKQRLIPEEVLPGSKDRAAQAKAAASHLSKSGYQIIGLDHFAHPDDALAKVARQGKLRRNFQGYTTDQADTLIGFGATSIGRTPFGYVQNISETGAWARAVALGELPVTKGHKLSQDDKARSYVIERLMCNGTVDTTATGQHFGFEQSWCLEAIDDLQDMLDDGLLVFEDGYLRMTKKGLPFVRVAASAFDSYLRQKETRHSLAI